MRENPEDRGVVIQHFETVEGAEAAVRRLRDTGFTEDEISVVAQEDERAEAVADDTGEDVATGAGIGAVTGGALGGIAGLLAGASALAIPGIGVVIAGPLAALVGSAGAGAIGGGLIGALAALGVSEDEAEYYRDRYEAGDILVIVAAGAREDEARDILGVSRSRT